MRSTFYALAGAGLLVMAAGCAPEGTTGTDAPPSTGAPASTAAPSATTISTDKPATVAESDYKTLPSGVKYAVLKEGSGPEAEHNEVFVHYTGWLESNKEKFDSSVERGEPLPFTLGHGGVIPGWQEGIKGMKVGEQRQLVIPPDMAYGAEGTPGGPIPPNATLIFDVELMRMGEGHSH